MSAKISTNLGSLKLGQTFISEGNVRNCSNLSLESIKSVKKAARFSSHFTSLPSIYNDHNVDENTKMHDVVNIRSANNQH